MIGVFVLSVAVVLFYLLFLIPHSVTTTEIVEEGLRHEQVTTYPMSAKEYFFESLKLFSLINIPNFYLIIKKINRIMVGIDS